MAMDLLENGVDRSVIALWLGHERVETTQIYLACHEGKSACEDIPSERKTRPVQTWRPTPRLPEQSVTGIRLCRVIARALRVGP
jgi:hypothetical protein